MAELLCEPENVVAIPAQILQQAFTDFSDLESTIEDGPQLYHGGAERS